MMLMPRFMDERKLVMLCYSTALERKTYMKIEDVSRSIDSSAPDCATKVVRMYAGGVD